MKKVWILALVSLLVLTLFVGCSNDNDNNEKMDDGKSQDVDAVTTASLVTEADAFVKAMSMEGTWIVAALNDIVLEEDLVVEGEFTNRDVVARKIALYTQDDDRKIMDRYTLTLPKLIVKSENMSIKGGTVVGDIYVEANGFSITELKVQGNIYFATQAYKDSFVMDEENSEVTGSMDVQ